MKTRDAYLKDLERRIANLPPEERRDIMNEYEDHFIAGLENGRSEQQICASLGSPKSVAQEIMMTAWVKKADQPSALRSPAAVLQIALIILILAPFNFFMLMIPFMVMFVLVFSFWALPLALGGVTLGMFVYFWTAGGDPVGFLSGLSLFFMFLGGLGITLLSALIMWALTVAAFKTLIAFIKWNIDFINARRNRANLQGSTV